MTSAVIVDAVRTPLAKRKPGGASSEIHPAMQFAERAGLDLWPSADRCGALAPGRRK
jgi:hypothetical protein